MSRIKTTIQAVLVAATLLLAAGTPAAARGAEGQAEVRITKQEQRKLPALMRWLKIRLSRYAMAAN